MLDDNFVVDLKFANKLSPSEKKKLKTLAFKRGELILHLNGKLNPLDMVLLATNFKGTFVGWLYGEIYRLKKQTNIDVSLYVSRHYRKRGLGRLLVEKFEEHLKTILLKDKKIIFVHPHNPASRAFYSKLGYKTKLSSGIHWRKDFRNN